MKKTAGFLALLLAALMLLSACSTPKKAADKTAAFVPKLDTQKNVELGCAVFFGNFEAFDQVINDFNKFYPNVKISYSQIFTYTPDFMEANPNIDIMMTSTEKGYPQEQCVDLTAAGVDVSAVGPGLLASTTVDGKLLSIPMGLRIEGMVVNKTLLAKEGLTVPETWPDFLKALETLKQKGYTPIQGPNTAVASLCYAMGMSMVASDEKLHQAVVSGDAEGAAALKVVFDRLLELQDKGYISQEVNETYPKNNYDEAILKFFEGDVPFWVCDTEKVSGMKKRESKSEAFSAEPFEYTFIYAPLGDTGVYEFVEPWYGFAVNKGSSNSDYAVEFLRFLARGEELDTLASIKGVPSVTNGLTDARYAGLNDVKKVEKSVMDDCSVQRFVGENLRGEAVELLTGSITTSDEALSGLVSRCAEAAIG